MMFNQTEIAAHRKIERGLIERKDFNGLLKFWAEKRELHRQRAYA